MHFTANVVDASKDQGDQNNDRSDHHNPSLDPPFPDPRSMSKVHEIHGDEPCLDTCQCKQDCNNPCGRKCIELGQEPTHKAQQKQNYQKQICSHWISLHGIK